MKFLIYVIIAFGLSCGLFHKGVPKKGEFCYLLSKPPECIFVDFEEKTLLMEGQWFPLNPRTRLEFTFPLSGQEAELFVTAEHRVDIKIPGQGPDKFYMRKKERFSQFPKSKE
ncbi:hypothetical protein LPTSP4_17740 [Leptospira ryugenii]|uniref:Lipoprotein n=1 Tax=Leptospira ryugenii TaxID=1917863 RepID=A0A2P2E053_9LEPT|nr:hypothetical protein [Leptospira ryugenii]GBF50250.1 hypothetical protein LPTSP4_17740 [Leptospira ryugenii]